MSPREILVVEDDDAIATGLSLNLKLAGHAPTVARDGDAALAELLARIDAVLRRTNQTTLTPIAVPLAADDALGFGDVAIDLQQRVVTRASAEVKLTHLELELLVFFVRHPRQVFSRVQLFSLVWGQSAGSVRTVDNFVGQLRKRFEADPEQPRHFITVRGSGYRFDP